MTKKIQTNFEELKKLVQILKLEIKKVKPKYNLEDRKDYEEKSKRFGANLNKIYKKYDDKITEKIQKLKDDIKKTPQPLLKKMYAFFDKNPHIKINIQNENKSLSEIILDQITSKTFILRMLYKKPNVEQTLLLKKRLKQIPNIFKKALNKIKNPKVLKEKDFSSR